MLLDGVQQLFKKMIPHECFQIFYTDFKLSLKILSKFKNIFFRTPLNNCPLYLEELSNSCGWIVRMNAEPLFISCHL